MGLLDRLRTWFGLADDASEMEPSNTNDASQDSTGLDPSKVTEVRTETKNGPVEKLRELDSDDAQADDEG
jgi:hypothetical protein